MPDSTFYKSSGSHTLKVLADLIGASLSDSSAENIIIEDICALSDSKSQGITFFHRKEMKELLEKTSAKACIISSEMSSNLPSTVVPLIVKNPYGAFARVASYFYPTAHQVTKTHSSSAPSKIHPLAYVHDSVQMGDNVEIGPNTRVGANVSLGKSVKIGQDCDIHENVTISHAIIGDRVRIHAGARIGQTGFGFAIEEGKILDIPQLGRVIIEDHVRIGANTTIDRGTLEDTIIGAWCRIDNLVQIAHNVILGKGCVIVSQVGIAGSTQIGDYSMLGGQVGVADHLKIGKGVKIAAQSGVAKNIDDGATMGGYPAVPLMEWHRQTIALSKLIKK